MRFIPWIFTLLLVATHSIANANIDVVTFANGNKLIGELKKLERGKLVFETDSTGSVEIEWKDVTSLVSEQILQFEFLDGTVRLGNLKKAREPGLLAIQSPDETVTARLDRVASIQEINREFVDRLDVSVRAGFNYAKGSEVGQFNLGADAEYRTKKRELSLDANSIATDSSGTTTHREDVKFTYRGLREDRWFTAGLLKLETNEELDIDFRTSIGGGMGRIMLESDNKRIALTGGLLVNRENLTGGSGSDTTLEGVITLNYDWFRFDTPELDVKSTLTVYPGITDSDRVRTEFDLRYRWEIIEDLFWEMEYYNNYDSGREADAESVIDYGIITSVGYKF